MDLDRQTDAQLLVAARTDAESFRVLYDRYAERAFAFFQRRTGNREASLDLTAETFARAWLGRERFRDLAGGSAGPWLFAIARRVLIASVELRRLESGGCVATSDDGRIWECYLGDEAVRRGFVDKGFLGQYLPEPPHG